MSGGAEDEVIHLGPALPETEMERDPQDPADLQLAQVNTLLENLVYDFDKETTDEYNADIKMTLLNWFAEKDSGALSPRESLDDHPFMAKLNKLKDTIVYNLKRNLRPDVLTMKGDNAQIVREQFDKIKPKLLEELRDLKAQMISHQSAVEQAQEPDIAQASDPVVQYLKDAGFHIRLAPGMNPTEIRAEIMRALRQAKIGEDPEALEGILAQTNVQVAPHDKTLTKYMFLDALAPALDENEENDMRRNWFMQAGSPTSSVPRRPVPPDASARSTMPPQQTAKFDDRSKLMPPPPKKGARSGEPEVAASDSDYYEERFRLIASLLAMDEKSADAHMTTRDAAKRREGAITHWTRDEEFFHEGKSQMDHFMRRLAKIVATYHPHTITGTQAESDREVSNMIDRTKNLRWAHMEQAVMGEYLDSHAAMWDEAWSTLKKLADSDMWPKVTEEYEDVEGLGKRPHGRKLKRHEAVRVLHSQIDEDKHPRGSKLDFAEDSVLYKFLQKGKRVRGFRQLRAGRERQDKKRTERQTQKQLLKGLESLNNLNRKHMRDHPAFGSPDHPQTKQYLSAYLYDQQLSKIGRTSQGEKFLKLIGARGASNRTIRAKRDRLVSDTLSRPDDLDRAMMLPLFDYYHDTKGLTDFTDVTRVGDSRHVRRNKDSPYRDQTIRLESLGIKRAPRAPVLATFVSPPRKKKRAIIPPPKPRVPIAPKPSSSPFGEVHPAQSLPPLPATPEKPEIPVTPPVSPKKPEIPISPKKPETPEEVRIVGDQWSDILGNEKVPLKELYEHVDALDDEMKSINEEFELSAEDEMMHIKALLESGTKASKEAGLQKRLDKLESEQAPVIEEIPEVSALTPNEMEELLLYMKPDKRSKGTAKKRWDENPTQARLDLAKEMKQRQIYYKFILKEDKAATAAELDKRNYNEIRKTYTALWNQFTNRGYAASYSSLGTAVQLGVGRHVDMGAQDVTPAPDTRPDMTPMGSPPLGSTPYGFTPGLTPFGESRTGGRSLSEYTQYTDEEPPTAASRSRSVDSQESIIYEDKRQRKEREWTEWVENNLTTQATEEELVDPGKGTQKWFAKVARRVLDDPESVIDDEYRTELHRRYAITPDVSASPSRSPEIGKTGSVSSISRSPERDMEADIAEITAAVPPSMEFPIPVISGPVTFPDLDKFDELAKVIKHAQAEAQRAGDMSRVDQLLEHRQKVAEASHEAQALKHKELKERRITRESKRAERKRVAAAAERDRVAAADLPFAGERAVGLEVPRPDEMPEIPAPGTPIAATVYFGERAVGIEVPRPDEIPAPGTPRAATVLDTEMLDLVQDDDEPEEKAEAVIMPEGMPSLEQVRGEPSDELIAFMEEHMTESESEMRHEGTSEQFYEFIAQQLLQRVTDPALTRPLREYLGRSSVAASQVSGQFPGPPSAEGRSSVAASQGGVFHVDERDILLHAVEELQDMIYKARDPDVEDEDLQGYWTQLTAELGPVAYPLGLNLSYNVRQQELNEYRQRIQGGGPPSSDPTSEALSTQSLSTRSSVHSDHDIDVLFPHLPAVPQIRRRALRRPIPVDVRRNYRNVVHANAYPLHQVLHPPVYGRVQADPGLPLYGRVHLVKMSNVAGDDHFMHELIQDANMGRLRVQTSRKGPFKSTSGHIKTMARSSHIVYRVRGRVIQVTVYRGVTKRELDVMFGKLGAHRLSTPKTICTLVLRGKKRKLGDLQTLDLNALRGALLRGLATSKAVGVSLHDIGKEGSLHRQHRPEREYI